MSLFRIGELAEAVGVRKDTIRYYERTGLIPPPGRTSAGYRLYDKSDVDRIRFIRAAQALDFTLAETQTLLQLTASDTVRASDILAVTRARLREAKAKVEKLDRICAIFEQLVETCPQEAATDDRLILMLRAGIMPVTNEGPAQSRAGEEQTTSTGKERT